MGDHRKDLAREMMMDAKQEEAIAKELADKNAEKNFDRQMEMFQDTLSFLSPYQRS